MVCLLSKVCYAIIAVFSVWISLKITGEKLQASLPGNLGFS